MKKSFIYILVALICCIACDDNTGTLGNSITPGSDSIDIKTRTYYATTRSVAVDSVLGKTSKVYLGRFTDPQTGSLLEADFIAQFNCVEGGNVFPPADSIKGDSAVRTELRLFFTTFFGDSTNTMEAEVYQLLNTLEEGEKYYTNVDPTLFYDPSSSPLTKKVYTAIDYTLEDSELSDNEHYANVCIPLPNHIGNEMIKTYRSNPEFFANATSFIENICSGYYIKSTHGDGTVLYIDQVALNVHFADMNTDSVYVTQFVSSEEVLQTSRFSTQKVDHLVADSTCTYLKTPAGIFTEVTLPIAEMTADGDSINSAKIIFTRYNDAEETRYQFGTPETLLLVRKSEMDTFFEKNRLTDNVSAFYTTYNKTYNRYEYSNIARLIIHAENERQAWLTANPNATESDYDTTNPDWNKVVLIPVTTIKDSNGSIVNFRHDLSLNSARLVGGNDKIEIKVICSAFKN
ncbi:MAG: DUF4270 domain-containing protein [Bacteroidaceae bacterium]|nr:DUF4270 domain-containing protein [Bacteroidaceae bacterium]